jgi:hypothetical protein
MCLCCEDTEISQFEFQCGHVIAETNGGEMIVDNLLPICAMCNNSMATEDLYVFQAKLRKMKNKK